jgi:MFS family permease
MYQLDPKSLKSLRWGRWSGLGPNVFFLGITSFLTDISSEMVTSVLPIYLVFALGLTPLQFGIVDGLSQGAAALARLASGLIADRFQRNREVAAFGYGLSAACKLLLLAAGNAWTLLSAAIALDRVGKGIRTGPRDALISVSSAPERLGLAFGVHRAFDTAGAMLGPLTAFAILAMLPQAFDLVFVVSFFVAVAGVAALLCFAKNVSSPETTDRPRTTAREVGALLRQPSFRALIFIGTGLGLMTVADSFIFLMLQKKLAAEAAWFPLFYVATALAYLLLAIPAGRLGDRFGRGRMFIVGHVLLLFAGLSLFLPDSAGLVSGALALLLLGAYYACTDGVLMALASAFVPQHLRASGLSIVATANGVSRLLASVLFGAIWNWHGMEFALAVFSGGLAIAIVLATLTFKRLKEVD